MPTSVSFWNSPLHQMTFVATVTFYSLWISVLEACSLFWMSWFPGPRITSSARLPLVLHSVGDHFLDPKSSFLVYSLNLLEHTYQWFFVKLSLVGSVFQLMSTFPSHSNNTLASNTILGCILFSLRILKVILLCLAFRVAPQKTNATLTFNLPDFVSFWKSPEPLSHLRYFKGFH